MEDIEPAVKSEEKQRKIAKSMASRISDLVFPAVWPERNAGAGYDRKDGERKSGKGVRVAIKDEGVRVNIHIAVTFGESIPDIARQIQRDTKKLFDQLYPEYPLTSVNVWVDSVMFDQDSVLYRKQAVESMDEAYWRQNGSGGKENHETERRPGTGDEGAVCQ